MGKDKQVKRARKSIRKAHCITCDKSMSWEFFRNNHKHKRHGGKNVPLRVISESQLRQDNANNKPTHSGTGPTAEHKTSNVRSFFEVFLKEYKIRRFTPVFKITPPFTKIAFAQMSVYVI